MMMALWSAALWLMDLVFGVLDRFLTPDVTDPGLNHLYGVTLWLSSGRGAGHRLRPGRTRRDTPRRPDPRRRSPSASPSTAPSSPAGSPCARGLILGCAGLTRGLLNELLDVPGFAGYAASAGLPDHVAGTVAGRRARASARCSCVIPAAFGYLLIMLVREAALLILVATMPIAAAGALGDGTKAWMWKSIRWFVAACLTSPLLALVVGLGVQISRAAFPEAEADGRATACG